MRGIRVCSFIVSWGYAYEKLGRAPRSVEEYAELGGVSVPTAYRDQKLFREALPGESTPTRIWKSVRTKLNTADDAAPARLGAMSVEKLRLAG